MKGIITFLQYMQLHPVIDHFTVALLTVGILTDLVASAITTRQWVRNMALTLMILGAAAAAGSYITGDAEIERMWKMLSPEAQAYFHPTGTISTYFGHGHMGYNLMLLFGVLALWRLAMEFAGFIEKTRALYLTVAVLSLGLLAYQGKTGGELVYHYGVGTGAMEPGAGPESVGTASATPAARPGGTKPAGTPKATPSTAGTEIPTPFPSPEASESPGSTPVPSGSAIATPSATSTGTNL